MNNLACENSRAIPTLLVNHGTLLLPLDLLMEKVPQLDYAPALAVRKSQRDQSVFSWSIDLQKGMALLGSQLEPVVSALANRALDHYEIARELIERGSSARDVHAAPSPSPPPSSSSSQAPPSTPRAPSVQSAASGVSGGATGTSAAPGREAQAPQKPGSAAVPTGKQSPFAAHQAAGKTGAPQKEAGSGRQVAQTPRLSKQSERERQERMARAFPIYLPALHAYDYLRSLDRAKYNVFDIRPISTTRQHPVFLPLSYYIHNWRKRL